MTYSPPTQYATEKQLSFIKALLEQRVVTTEVKDHVEGFIVSGAMTKAEASKRIEWLLAQPKVEKPKPVYADVPEGMHKVGETIWKVYRTRNGHQVASQLREIDGAWGFEYRGKAGLKGLSEATRMPADEAAKFGKTYGICVRCAAQLTDERSIFAGYGPVCAKNQGWPYPTMDEAMEGLGLGIYADPATAPLTDPIVDKIVEKMYAEPDPWYEADTVEEAMGKLDATTAPKIEFLVSELADLAEMESAVKGKEDFGAGAIVMPDDGDILTPEQRAAYETRVGTPGFAAGMKEAAEALESFAEVLKEHAIVHPSGLTPADVYERINRVCDEPECDEKVFTMDEIKREVHLTINPDYCPDHDSDTIYKRPTYPIKELPSLADQLLPEDI